MEPPTFIRLGDSGVRSGRRRSHGVCSAQSGTTEQLGGPLRPRSVNPLSSSRPPQVFGAVWMLPYEDEIRSVEGPSLDLAEEVES